MPCLFGVKHNSSHHSALIYQELLCRHKQSLLGEQICSELETNGKIRLNSNSERRAGCGRGGHGAGDEREKMRRPTTDRQTAGARTALCNRIALNRHNGISAAAAAAVERRRARADARSRSLSPRPLLKVHRPSLSIGKEASPSARMTARLL